ncbi:spore coat protein SP96-like [Eriocheir sinensis]|uniref:spore coat protein SP96-like n=1 Tax=Eriocheir sinensis TaxID=95602 RepID=UPI0021CA6DE2|nr:spore coat protein SP96-like [Eriocheir sinensis]
MRCAAEGRFAHPDNHKAYVDCVPDVEGNVLQAHVGSCRDGVFHPDLKKCLPAGKENQNATGHHRRGRMMAWEKNYNSVCSKIRNGFSCLSCKTLVNCVAGRAYTEECDAGYTCRDRNPFQGAVCYPSSPVHCSCGNKRELLPDPYNPQAYLECMSGVQDPVVRFCHRNMIFSKKTYSCQYPENYVECSRRGVFPNPKDCTEYYKCVQTIGGLLQYTFQCTCGFLFNEITGRCEDPCSYQPQKFTCKREGRFPNQYDCRSYYVCTAKSTPQTGFRESVRRCPHGFIWSTGSVAGTGLCKPGNTSLCAHHLVPRCAVPKGRSCAATPTVTTGGSCMQGSPNCQCNSATGQLSCRMGHVANGKLCRAPPTTSPTTASTTTPTTTTTTTTTRGTTIPSSTTKPTTRPSTTSTSTTTPSSTTKPTTRPSTTSTTTSTTTPSSTTKPTTRPSTTSTTTSTTTPTTTTTRGTTTTSTTTKPTTTTTKAPPLECWIGWQRFGSACYLFDSTSSRNWDQARSYCRTYGGDLVKITSQGENQFIGQNIKNKVWIGINDQKNENVFVWTDGSRPGYTAWEKGQPDDFLGEDCVEMWTKSFGWNDIPCTHKLGTVCQRPAHGAA